MIYPLSEGIFTVGRDKLFVPFDTGKEILTDRPTGSLLVEVQPFLVVTEKDVLLLDTGLGFADEQGVFQLHYNIRMAGYEPEQVTRVLLSHLHKDHAGGVCVRNQNGILSPSLPNAVYHIYQAEADEALQTGMPSYMPHEIEPLLRSGQVSWLNDDEGDIDGYIRYFHSGGHSRQHVVYLIEDAGEKIFFGGDEAPQLKQMKIKYIAKYDYDGKKAMQLREEYTAQGRRENWKFLFYHDVQVPFAQHW